MISLKAKQLSSNQHIKMSRFVGENGQRRFYDSCRAAGIDIKKASASQDMKHIDFIVNGETVDAKGIKNTHKKGQILLEIKNVQGKDGWCSKSGPDWIAFDFGLFFIQVLNKDLQKLIKKNCDLTKRVSKISDALHKGYSRKDRDDLMTIVLLTDVIKSCKHSFLPIEPFYEEMELL